MPDKKKDPGQFTIPCQIREVSIEKRVKSSKIARPYRLVQDVRGKVKNFIFLVEFVILGMIT